MNSKLDLIFNRRSIRKYEDKGISREVINDIMEAAMSAPSAVNRKPYEFIIIDDKNTLKEVAQYLPNGGFLSKAPLGIIVCGDIKSAHAESLSYMLQDCSAAIENLLVAVSGLGLGACWLGVHPKEDRIAGLKSIFNFPENIIPISVISVGYPEGELPQGRTQYDAKKIHFNRW